MFVLQGSLFLGGGGGGKGGKFFVDNFQISAQLD